VSSEAVPTRTFATLSPTVATDLISSIRLTLAPLALLFVTVEGFGPQELIRSIKALLILHAVYAFVLWLPRLRTKPVIQSIQRYAAWIDITWFTIIFAFSHGNHLPIFLGVFLFATLSSSVKLSYGSGLRLGSAAIIATAAIGMLLQLESNQLTGLLLLLMVIVCLTALLASRLELQRERNFLQQITSLSHPHLGADRIIGTVLEKIRSFYSAYSCVLIMREGALSSYRIWRVDRQESVKRLCGEAVSEELRLGFAGLSSPKAMVYSRRSSLWSSLGSSYHEIEVGDASPTNEVGNETVAASRDAFDRVATILEAESLISIPISLRNQIVGQFYLTSQNPNSFSPAEAKAVYQMITSIFPIVENLRLADRLASEATDRERAKMACDIHDSVIQPYVGIQLGLTALRRKIQRGEVDLEEDIAKLMEMTDGEIFGLRRYMAVLKGKDVNETTLLESVRSFARKFSSASGIPVEVRNGSEMKIGDRLAEEVFQMIVEGLSNIRKHTQANRAVIRIGREQKHLAVKIEDEGPGEETHRGFIPRSIMTRVTALGGQVQVRPSNCGGTSIDIKIPL
jgi:signal transduction histidine kinase